ncbi:hypothetical protein GCM10009085_51660 [Pseudomonas avellanae]|nr:hypothetical protein GCM10009085_51660 [Pseudomonas avellanae]
MVCDDFGDYKARFELGVTEIGSIAEQALRRSGRVKSTSCFRIYGSRFNHKSRDAWTHA